MAAGAIVSQFATGAGFIAAAIAIGGFLAHARPALAEEAELKLRRATVVGGLWGLVAAVFLIVVSTIMG